MYVFMTPGVVITPTDHLIALILGILSILIKQGVKKIKGAFSNHFFREARVLDDFILMIATWLINSH